MIETFTPRARRLALTRQVAGAASLLALSGVAGASGIFDVETIGTNIAYFELVPDTCEVEKLPGDPGNPARTALVQGSATPCVTASDPGPDGYIELGDEASQVWSAGVQTLTGKLPAGFLDYRITLSSLLEADWNQRVNAQGVVDAGSSLTLAERYIIGGYEANCEGDFPTDADLAPYIPSVLPVGTTSASLLQGLVTCFLDGEPCPPIGMSLPKIVPSPAERASDPDIAYVNRVEESAGPITLGLGGRLDDADLLPTGFVCLTGPYALSVSNPTGRPPQVSLSEVVKVTTRCGGNPRTQPQYLFSFEPASESGITTDPEGFYDAIYEVSPIGSGDCYLESRSIPTLSLIGQLMLGLLMLVSGAWRLRR